MSLSTKGATCQNKARPARRRLEEAFGRVEELREREGDNVSGGEVSHPRVPRNPRSLPSRRLPLPLPPARRPGRAAGPAFAGGRTGSQASGAPRSARCAPALPRRPQGPVLRGSRSAGGEARPWSAAGVETGERRGGGGRGAPKGRAVPRPLETSEAERGRDEFPDPFGRGDRLRGAGGASRSPSPCVPWGLPAAPARRTQAPGRAAGAKP